MFLHHGNLWNWVNKKMGSPETPRMFPLKLKTLEMGSMINHYRLNMWTRLIKRYCRVIVRCSYLKHLSYWIWKYRRDLMCMSELYEDYAGSTSLHPYLFLCHWCIRGKLKTIPADWGGVAPWTGCQSKRQMGFKIVFAVASLFFSLASSIVVFQSDFLTFPLQAISRL